MMSNGCYSDGLSKVVDCLSRDILIENWMTYSLVKLTTNTYRGIGTTVVIQS